MSANRACAYCAITLCPQCMATFDINTGLVRPCHPVDDRSSLCLACTKVPNRRALAVPIDRVLTYSTACHPNVAIPVAAAAGAVPAPGPPPFRHFYDQPGACRSFDLFDATDVSLWVEPLPFQRVHVFASAAHARYALASDPLVRRLTHC